MVEKVTTKKVKANFRFMGLTSVNLKVDLKLKKSIKELATKVVKAAP
jgi:hypothetical protein